MILKLVYQTYLKELIQANKNNDIVWFSNKRNRKKCKILIGYWSSMNSNNPTELYKQAIKKLAKLLKNTRTKTRYNKYLKSMKEVK